MSWLEELHPRDPAGRFMERGGGWIGEVSDRMAAAHGKYVPVRGHDIRGELDMVAVKALHDKTPEDKMLGAIYEHQGFDGLPEVLDQAEMDQRIEAGWQELWRGVDGAASATMTSKEMADALRSGHYWAGEGVRGNGTYTSPHRTVAHGYTQREGDWWGPIDDTYEQPGSAWPGLIRMALRPDAKVIEWSDIDGLVSKQIDSQGQLFNVDVLTDEGRLAAALGYDAIIVRSSGFSRQNPQASSIRMVVVLNRTAVAVQEAWQ
jgi:hypothetical protein